VAVAIETLLDIKNISVEEVTDMLCAIEERRKPAAAHDSQGRLLLCKDEWMAKLKLRESEAKGGRGTSSGSGDSSSKKRGARGCERGRTNRESSNSGSRDSNKGDCGGGPAVKRDQCKRCGKYGHWARECRSKPKGEAHLTQAEDDSEPTLLMARASLVPTALPPQTGQIRISPGRRPLRIIEAKVYIQLDEETEWDDSLWYMDSGATNHMSGCRLAFVDIDTSIRGTVKFGDGSEVAIEGSGTVLFEGKTGEHLPLTGVYFIPWLTTNIISLGQLDEGGCDVHAHHGVLRIRDDKGRLVAWVQRSANRLYLLWVKIARPLYLAVRASNDAWLWHERYGHLHFEALKKLEQRGMVQGITHIEHVHRLCADCVTTKLKRSPFLSQAKRRAEGLLDLVHGDLCGPISSATPGGKRYFLLLVDDKNMFMWLALLSAKSDTLTALKKFQAKVEVETGRRLRVLRTDNGGEFTSVEFEMYCAEHGVERQHTTPYTPQQNDVVEQRNQSVVTMARSLLKSRSMPAMLWGEAVATAVYLLNRAPTKAIDVITPYEAWHGRRPDVHHLRTFGCVAYIKATKPRLKKLEDRGTPVVFIGYERGAKAWRFYDPVLRRAVVSWDAVFDEPTSWN
jgi:transposase InsO family protein